MRYTVLLVPDEEGQIAVSVPAMPGCFSLGHTRAEALAHVQEAMRGWLAAETEQGRSRSSTTCASRARYHLSEAMNSSLPPSSFRSLP
ncbi:MAG TPA: type II toxin-antitoxin system HicB family antitoxin [Chloroflexota bacterium]